ncbi:MULTISPECIES: cold-shock protein [Leptospira]|uniref:Cold-shock DNA-binding domain protein n=1 Tax=Leptospira weilii str. UI 13098 TaxID=1088542 RepID=M6Q3L9_9LEPT|nr:MULTISPECIES: cold shock domain-containing protein [Leptospira]EMN89894.1 cold-shock DNA-binding domain protein [Leptospira weilii str. UI 13098]OMI16726.1 cold-shock protein [Leptospira weilii serovar Heyan]
MQDTNTTEDYFIGTIKKYVPWNRTENRGGFGFITSDSNGRDYFFNAKYSEIKDEHIKAGMTVSFELRRGYDKKRSEFVTQATHIQRL